MLATVDSDHLAVDISGLVRNQISGQVGKFLWIANPTKRVLHCNTGSTLTLSGVETFPSTGNGKGTGGECDASYPAWSPLDRKNTRHGEYCRL